MEKRLLFAATVVVLGVLGAIFGKVVSSLTSGPFAAAVAAFVLCVAYYWYRKVYPDQKKPLVGLLEFLALVFVGALVLYVVEAFQ
jgi:uncharacterized membrane protein (DUF4010 family)